MSILCGGHSGRGHRLPVLRPRSRYTFTDSRCSAAPHTTAPDKSANVAWLLLIVGGLGLLGLCRETSRPANPTKRSLNVTAQKGPLGGSITSERD
jgi:hypothetical protein